MNPGLWTAGYKGYTSLDPAEPIRFDGTQVEWNGRVFHLDEHTIFLDYRLDSEQIAGNPYAFNNIQDAAKALKHGTANKPMLLLVAPGVYWVDDPDDPEVRVGRNGEPPFGMTIACDYLYFYGLNTDARNAVFAVNRGQTQGASGNFTMFKIQGVGLRSENVSAITATSTWSSPSIRACRGKDAATPLPRRSCSTIAEATGSR